MKDKKLSDNTKKLIGIATSKRQLGSNNPNYGKSWINNGIENKIIKRDKIDEFILNGWKKGRIKND